MGSGTVEDHHRRGRRSIHEPGWTLRYPRRQRSRIRARPRTSGTQVDHTLNPAEFDNIARAEERLWWYRGMNRILFRLIDRYAPASSLNVLEAGSGTGYLT